MEVYALVGKAGTGKSYKATEVAFVYNIDTIIDDGLIIQGKHKIGGQSAKRAATRISAVKCALFFHWNHRKIGKEALKKASVQKILILGTSKKMVDRICENLELPQATKTFFIESISTEEEIKKAKYQRQKYGKHVIPLPAVALRQDFSGYVLDAIRTLGRKKGKVVEMAEKTVVRPTFSYMGEYTISRKAFLQIIERAAGNFSSVQKVGKIQVLEKSDSIYLKLDVILTGSCSIPVEGKKVQNSVKNVVESMTGVFIEKVHLYVRNIHYKKP